MQKRGEKGLSSEEVGIIQQLFCPSCGWKLGDIRGASRLKPNGAPSCYLVSFHLERQPGYAWQSDKAPSLMTHCRTALVSNNFALCCDFRGCELKK